MSDYLWDKSDPVDTHVKDFERRLGVLRFDATRHPFPAALRLTPRPARGRFSWPATLGVAASIVFACAFGFHQWRLDWQTGRAWSIAERGGELPVGARFTALTPTTVEIARLGELRAARGASLSLLSTGPTKHRLSLTEGTIDVRLWSPPWRVTVATPAGDVIDLGCIFRLTVDREGQAHLRVETGWVSLENSHGESFIPAGASATMRADREPHVPVYDDAPDIFRAAVREIQQSRGSFDGSALQSVVSHARRRDVLTLLTLSQTDGLSADLKRVLLDRAAVFHAPPSPDGVERIVGGGDRELFWKWYDSLPLPTLKNWWRNWRDALPR